MTTKPNPDMPATVRSAAPEDEAAGIWDHELKIYCISSMSMDLTAEPEPEGVRLLRVAEAEAEIFDTLAPTPLADAIAEAEAEAEAELHYQLIPSNDNLRYSTENTSHGKGLEEVRLTQHLPARP